MNTIEEAQEAIRRAQTPAEIHALLFEWQGRMSSIIVQVAKHARVWDDSLLFMVLADSGYAVVELLNNPHRSEDMEVRAMQWAMARLNGETDLGLLLNAAEVLRVMGEARKFPIRGPIGQKLFELIEPTQEPIELSRRQEVVFSILIAHPELGGDDLLELYDRVRGYLDNDDQIALILRHSAAPPQIWRQALLESKPGGVPATLMLEGCRRAEIRRDPVVRERLIEYCLKAGLVSHLTEFIGDLIPEDCAELLRKQAVAHRPSAEDTLLDYGRDIAPYLTVDDLQPFLLSSKPEVRLAAIACLGHAQRPSDGNRDLPVRSR